MKKIILIIASALLLVGVCFADAAGDIAAAGDKEWDAIVSQYKSSGKWENTVSASIVAGNLSKYYGKIMQFPKIDFSNFVTDKNGKKYYYCGEKSNWNIFVIKYNDGIQDLLYKLNNALGNKSGDYEVIGKITDAYSWWGNVVEMEVVAMRIKNRACIKIKNGKAVLVGQEILDKNMSNAAATWSKGIPDNASSVPANLSAEDTAKWFLYYGSTKKNSNMWKKLCSVEGRAISASGNLSAKGESWWRMISKADREYYFVRADKSRSNATQKYFMYQIKINGQDVGVAKPMCVLKEKNGQWKVKSF